MASKNKNNCVFEKQVVLFLVSTRTVKRICNLISAEKMTFQREKWLALLCKEGSLRDARGDVAESISTYLSALPTTRVHPELDGHTPNIVHPLTILWSCDVGGYSEI